MNVGHFFMGFSFLSLLVMAALAVTVIGKAVADESSRLSKHTESKK